MRKPLQELIEEAGEISLLYVEDNQYVRESTLELLQMFFPHIDTANNGEEGLARYHAFRETEGRDYDLVLTDINMPKLNGIDMIKAIKEENDRQVIAVFSAHNESEYLISLIDLEVTHFILKPIDIERFEKVLGHAVEIIVQRRQYAQATEHLAVSKQTAEEATAQKLTIEPYNFNPYEDLIMIAELFQAKAAEKKIVFQIRYNNDMPTILYGDALRIKQIFSNLLSNAIKFTPEGKKVKCVIWYKNGYLNIKVKDYGIGISKEKQKHIFEPFMQADGSTERTYGGSGLGLAISLELTKMLGGSLTLKSIEGVGSTFTLALPLEEGMESEEASLSPSGPEQGHVLIVEDYEANRMFLGIILENAGLTDENMPKMSGIEALKEIRKIEADTQREHTPVISLTANALQGDRERFIEAGFDDYLSKPVDPDDLMEIMGRLLSER